MSIRKLLGKHDGFNEKGKASIVVIVGEGLRNVLLRWTPGVEKKGS
jgi:hypothetical protein